MKTLDDALMTPGVIRPDSYNIGAGTVWMQSIGGEIALGGHGFTPAILRRIADHLAPPATEEPRGCPMPGACACAVSNVYSGLRSMDTAPRDRTPVIVKFRDDLNTIRDDLFRWNGLFAVMRYQDDLLLWGYHGPLGQGGFPDEWMVGWAALPECSASVPGKPDSSPVIPDGWRLVPEKPTEKQLWAPVEAFGWCDDDVEAAKRNPGEELGDFVTTYIEMLDAAPPAPLRTEAEVRAEAKREAEVRDDIEFGHFLDWTIALDKARAGARREALEEAAKVCDALQQKHNISFYGVVDRARDGVRNLELAGAAAAGMETSARQAAVAIRALIEKET